MPLFHRLAIVLASTAMTACSNGEERTPDGRARADSQAVADSTLALPPHGAPADDRRQTGPVGFTLDSTAAQHWRVRELRHLPKYFESGGWKDNATLWGRAGCNPVEVSVDAARFVAWNRNACGAALGPDGKTLAWTEGRGGVQVGERGGSARTLLQAETPSPAGEGDPTGLMLWSPDGTRILTSWAAEWESFFAVLDARTGKLTPLTTRQSSYFLTSAWGWLDTSRILFTVQAVRDQQGRSAYSESGGYRADLLVYDLERGKAERVTTVADSVYLAPLAEWGEGGLLVGERRAPSGRLERYWVYDQSDWRRRRPVPLPAGTAVAMADSAHLVVLDASETIGEQTTLAVKRGDSSPIRLGIFRGGRPMVAWSPDRRRIAITGVVEASDSAGNVATRYLGYVIEPLR